MSTNTVTTPPEPSLSRRGFFMKLGILFNGFAAIVLALPVARFLLSSITRGSGNGYLSWVPLGDVGNFPEGETRMATFRNPLVMPTARILAAPSAGSRNQVFLCVRVTAVPTTATAYVRPDHQSVAFSNIRTKSRTECSRLTPDSSQPPATLWQV
jgi:hypothetical protein